METFLAILFIIGYIWYNSYKDKEKRRADSARWTATHRPSYEAYQRKSPDTIKADKIEGTYNGEFNKEFEK